MTEKNLCDNFFLSNEREKNKKFVLKKIHDKSLMVRTTLHLNNGWDVLEAVLRDLAMFSNVVKFWAVSSKSSF